VVRSRPPAARLEASDGGIFSVDINGVLIRGHFVRVERPTLIEIACGEAGNAAMPPGATRLVITLAPYGSGTRVPLEHSGLTAGEARKHAVGWPHFIERLGRAAGGRDPGPDPWKTAPPREPTAEGCFWPQHHAERARSWIRSVAARSRSNSTGSCALNTVTSWCLASSASLA